MVHAGIFSRRKYDSIELQLQRGGFSDRSHTWDQFYEVYGDVGHLARYYIRLRNLELICKCDKKGYMFKSHLDKPRIKEPAKRFKLMPVE